MLSYFKFCEIIENLKKQNAYFGKKKFIKTHFIQSLESSWGLIGLANWITGYQVSYAARGRMDNTIGLHLLHNILREKDNWDGNWAKGE